MGLKEYWANMTTKKKALWIGILLVAAIGGLSDKKEKSAIQTSVPVTSANQPTPTEQVSQPKPENAPQSAKYNFVSGKQYKYYTDGSCRDGDNDVCIGKDEAKYLCERIYGYTKHFFDVITISGGDRAETLFKAGNVGQLSSSWQNDRCAGMISATGMYKGTSAKVTYDGVINTFVISPKGEVLAHSMFGTMNDY